MAFDLTRATRLASEGQVLEPQIVLEIDGVTTRYGARVISKKLVIGDEEVVLGGGWKIGGSVPLADQADLISLDAGTTTSIRQQLQPDKGIGSSISSMQVALIDRNGEATELVSPGVVVDDVLGRRARVYIGFANTSFPSDFVTIFRGIIDDVSAKAGMVVLSIAHPDQKKRQTIFTKAQTTVVYDGGTYMNVESTSGFLFAPFTPVGLQTYIKVEDEIIEYKGLWNTNALVRGQFGTSNVTHAADKTVDTFYRLKGNVIDIALRLMLSDETASPYVEDLDIGHIGFVDSETSGTQNLFFFNVDLVERYGVTVGDKVRIAGATNALNNYALSGIAITAIEVRYDGTILTLDVGTHTLHEERDTPATASIVSQYNILGAGLGMKPDEVDLEEHLRLKRIFLSSFEVDIYIPDEVNGKELIEQELYAPAGAYSLPRKSKASVGLHVGPMPGTGTKILSSENVKNASDLTVRRSLANNFYNTIIYKFDQDAIDSEFNTGIVTRSVDSTNRIPVGTRALVVEAKGLRSSLNGANLATAASNRRLNRYKFGAEYIENLKVTFAAGFNVEIGDIILLEGDGLGLINSASGDRSPPPKLYEVYNKTLNIRTGDVVLSLVDTSFSAQNRYGLMGPSSRIKSASSTSAFIIEQWQSGSRFGAEEFLKWTRFLTGSNTIAVKIRSSDFTARNGVATISSIVGNTVTLTTPLGFTPQAGDFMELADYDSALSTAVVKTLYGFMKDTAFADGGAQYRML